MSLYVKYIDAPEEALLNRPAVDASESQPFGEAAYLSGAGFPDIPWASLEPGSWVLDGTRRLLPDEPVDVGWWSENRSGDDGRFEVPPVISILLPPNTPVSAPGVTFQFWPSLGHWCTEVRVTWYYYEESADGTNISKTLVAQTTAHPDSPEWFLAQEVKDFNWVDIELLATNVPGHFAKLQYLQLGQVVLFHQDELVRVQLLTEVDPSACELSADELTVEIVDKKSRNLKPQKNQVLQLYRDGGLSASHYVQECTREERNRYVFKAQSVISQLENEFLGGFYSNAIVYDEQTDSGLLRDILGNVPILYGADYNLTVSGYLPVCSRREALQQVAFATGSVVSSEPDGSLFFRPPIPFVTNSFTSSDIFTGAKLKEEQQISTIKVNSHQYIQSEETETLLEGVKVFGEALFTFSEPHWGYEYNMGPQGARIETAANWVRVISYDHTWPVTLTGKKYAHVKREYIWTNEDATSAEKSNAIKVENVTLITDANAETVLDRLKAYHKNRSVLDQTVVVEGQRVCDMVTSPNPWGTNTVGYITKMDSAFTANGHTASVTIRGVEEEVPTE